MRIDPELCTGCGGCIDYCPVDAIAERNDIFFIDEDECVECGVCLRDSNCPVDAISMPEESMKYPRSLRAIFSDPAVQYPEELFPGLKQGGRGTEEMKTNDVTGKFPRGEYGITLEFGRPGIGTRLLEVEKVTSRLASLGVHMEEANALYFLMDDLEKGLLKEEVRNEKVLSVILELSVTEEKLEAVVTQIREALEDVNTVVSWGLVTRFEDDGSLPVIARLEKLGMTVRPNAKVNVGLGRPLVQD